jgi:hypothetical protein
MVCFCVGAGLCVLAYVMGVGAVLGAVFSGGNPALVVGGIFAAIGVTLAGVVGFILILVGGVWMIAQVIADQNSDASEKRYRDIER